MPSRSNGLTAEMEAVRTLALVGAAAAGKTSLAEALLHEAGAIGARGSVERGSTVSDHDPLERRMQFARVHVAIGQIAVDEGRIDLDHLLDQRAVRRVDGTDVGLPFAVEEAVHHPRAAGVGQAQREDDPRRPARGRVGPRRRVRQHAGRGGGRR